MQDDKSVIVTMIGYICAGNTYRQVLQGVVTLYRLHWDVLSNAIYGKSCPGLNLISEIFYNSRMNWYGCWFMFFHVFFKVELNHYHGIS